MKINCSGRINYIDFDGIYLTVFYSNQTMAYITGLRVGYFLKKYHEDLGQEAILAIEEYFKGIWCPIRSSVLPPLQLDDCVKLFERIFELITHKKSTSKKPLLILIGENHVSPQCLLIEMIVLDIIQRFGFENIFIETNEENLQSLKSGTNMNGYETSTTWDFLFHVISDKKYNIIPIDPLNINHNQEQITDLTRSYRTQHILHEILIANAVDEEKQRLLNQLKQIEETLNMLYTWDNEIMRARDQQMSSKISLHASKDSKIKLAIVGAAHLKGIYENLNRSNDYTILPILTFSVDAYNASNPVLIDPRELFFMSNTFVEKIFISKDCDIHNNFELFEMAAYAGVEFWKKHFNLLKNELKEIDNLLSKFAGLANLSNDCFVEIPEAWAECCHKLHLGRDGIVHAQQPPNIMRYEFKELLKDILKDMSITMKYQFGDAKLMNLFSALSELSQKFENANYQIKNLNHEERLQLSSFTQKI